MRYFFALIIVPFLCQPLAGWEPSGKAVTEHGDALAREYFRLQTVQLTDRTFEDVQSLEDWTSRREAYRKQLLEMLGLDPFPAKTPLKDTVTGILERDGVIVERIHFQSMPGLYVTANLYRPSKQHTPLPAILYVCGHGGVRRDGVSLGNKTHYQHHGAWFARNGYVCLTIDTIQLGEIEGIHHGTYREKMWWWNNRGYSPAGVEAWNCLRSLDYLQTRDEVDGSRLGVTGRSGGGAYSWWIAAIDDRIKAAVPVAGITSLKNHVVDGCVEGHCDCMFMVNTYRWDYPMVAALVAPRPLLISNSDKDRIFPLDGVIDVHSRVRTIYELYGASDHLGLQITEGPHKDTQELRIHAFRWFNRFLRKDDALVKSVATPIFDPQELRVFSQLPDDEIVTTIQETFVPKTTARLPQSDIEAKQLKATLLPTIRQKSFGGWPDATEPLNTEIALKKTIGKTTIQMVDFTSQTPYRLRLYLVTSEECANDVIEFNVLDQPRWEKLMSAIAVELPMHAHGWMPDKEAWNTLVQRAKVQPIVFFAPRGVGETEWSRDERTRTHIRRRFMQLGQTTAAMRVYDVTRAAAVIRRHYGIAEASPLTLQADGDASSWALYASLFINNVDSLMLSNLSPLNRNAPDLLNISRIAEPPHILLMTANQKRRVILGNRPAEWEAWQRILAGNAIAEASIELQKTEDDTTN